MGLFSPVHALLGQFALFGSHHSLFYAASLPFTKKLQHCKMFAGVFTSLHRWRVRMFSWDLAPVLQYFATLWYQPKSGHCSPECLHSVITWLPVCHPALS